MKIVIPLLTSTLMLITNLSYAQFCTSNTRFTEVDFFTTNEIDSSLNNIYATDVLDWQGNLQDLTMDIYYPSLSVDTLPERPFILMIHGGGFNGGSKEKMTSHCEQFAKKGFVAATIEYRVGYSGNNVPAIYRAQQDAKSAMRYIVENSTSLKIDTSWMFIGGASAGSVTSLNTVYVTESEWETNSPGIVTSLGPLNTSGNSYTHDFTIKGIFNNWGATLGSSIQVSELVPMISYHGMLDHKTQFDSTSHGLYGSGVIHDILLDNSICSELNLDSLGGHGIYGPRVDFRVSRSSCFFKSVFCNNCNSQILTDSISSSCSLVTTLSDMSVANNCIQLFHNPIADVFNITGDLNYYEIQILSSTGNVLIKVNSTSNNYTIDISHLPSGLYFIRATHLTNNQMEVQKILKE